MSERPVDPPVMRMRLDEVLRLVAELEERYRTWTLPHVAPTGTAPVPPVTLADLASDPRQPAAQCGASGSAARGLGRGAGQ